MADDLLVSSPYATSEHHLNLSSLPKSSQQLARALQAFKPITVDYPSQPYAESFNWQEVIDRLPSDFSGSAQNPPQLITGTFYCIAFYSTLSDNVDSGHLHYLDGLAHAEANQSGGLLKYWWQNPPDPTTRKNLATCIWTSWDDAKRAGKLPMHAKAMSATFNSYSKWLVERYYLRVEKGNKWSLERILV